MPGKGYYKSLSPKLDFRPGGGYGRDILGESDQELFQRRAQELIRQLKTEREKFEKTWKNQTIDNRDEVRQFAQHLRDVQSRLELKDSNLMATDMWEATAALAEAIRKNI